MALQRIVFKRSFSEFRDFEVKALEVLRNSFAAGDLFLTTDFDNSVVSAQYIQPNKQQIEKYLTFFFIVKSSVLEGTPSYYLIVSGEFRFIGYANMLNTPLYIRLNEIANGYNVLEQYLHFAPTEGIGFLYIYTCGEYLQIQECHDLQEKRKSLPLVDEIKKSTPRHINNVT